MIIVACLIIVCVISSIFLSSWTAPLNTKTSASSANSPEIDTTSQQLISWSSQPQANSPNAALLSGAIALMKNIYTYNNSAPNYLPTSYTNENTSLTAYVVHAVAPSNVSWAPKGKNQVEWQSVPGGLPIGWSGMVVAAGSTNTNGTPESVHVLTDCSGFITSLFAYANTETTTKFTGWQTGSSIPEAGCNDPQGDCTVPNPLNYYHLSISGENGWFENVSLANLQPGDIISYANTNNNKDSGHVMLVAAVSNSSDNQNSRYVVVIDETGSPHSYDTRNITTLPNGTIEGGGIGMGIAKLATSPEGQLQFFWNTTTPTPEIGSIALGQAQ